MSNDETPKDKPVESAEQTASTSQNGNSASGPVKSSKDSFDVPVKKSPLLMYALLQIPLVLFMVLLLYFMYQAKQD